MRRDFEEYENDNGAVVRAHRVTKETEGNVYAVGVGRVFIRAGDVLVESSNSNQYDVVSGRKFDEDYHRTDGTEETAEFNPSDHTAKEVREYLATADEDEQERVIDAERADKNRASALKDVSA